MDSKRGIRGKEPCVPQSLEGLLYDETIAAEVDQKIIKTGSLDLVVDKAEQKFVGR